MVLQRAKGGAVARLVMSMLAERWRSKQAEMGTWDRLKIKSVAVARTTTAKTAGMVSVVSSAATSSTTASSVLPPPIEKNGKTKQQKNSF